MDAVLGHGFHPLKARQRRSIPNLQTVHRHGRIPLKRTKPNPQAQDPALHDRFIAICGEISGVPLPV
jgi:hypothetical protein